MNERGKKERDKVKDGERKQNELRQESESNGGKE